MSTTMTSEGETHTLEKEMDSKTTSPKEVQKNDSSEKPQLEGEALREAIKKQIDYYFSKENLMTDRYLISQMNSDMFVPIKTIADFKMVKGQTTDLELLLSVMKESKSVIVDETETLVKPALKASRNTIILRDISSSADPEEIKSIFQGEQLAHLIDVKNDIGDCWYCTFDKDEAALHALDEIRSKTFRGHPIKARLKTENTFINFYAAPQTKLETQQGFTSPIVNSYNYRGAYPTNWGRGSNIPINYYGNWETNQTPNSGTNNVSNGNTTNSNDPTTRNYENRRGSSGGYRNRQRREYDSNGTGNRRGGRYNRGYQGNKEKENNSNRKRGGSGSGKTLQLGAADFPPLPSQTQMITPGYSTQFQKFTKEEMIKTFQEIPDFPKPDDSVINSMSDFKVFLSEPSLEIESLKALPKKITALEIVTKAQEINNPMNESKIEAQKTSKSEN